MEKAYFPMDYYRLTQGYGTKSSSHKSILALDIAGKDSGKDKIYAPFTGIIKKIYNKKGVAITVWFESKDKVLCANGEQTYLTCLFAHEENINHLYVGKEIKQGEPFLEEGKSGLATGNHIHLELSNKKFSKTGWFKNKSGDWQINNPVKPEEYLFLKSDQIILNEIYQGKKYSFKKDKVFTYEKVVKINNNVTINLRKDLNEKEYYDSMKSIADWIKKAL